MLGLGILLLCGSCNERAVEPELEFPYQFLKGNLISGTEYFFPLQFYDYSLSEPEVSPNGEELLYRQIYGLPRDSSGLYRLNLQTGERRFLVEGGYNGTWSPDGKWVAFNIYPQIYKIKTNGDSLTQLTRGEGSFNPRWSPDGRRIGFGGNAPYVNVVNHDGTGIGFIGDSVFAGIADWHPTGTRVMGGQRGVSPTTKLGVFNLQTNRTEQVLDLGTHTSVGRAFYSPDGSRICFNSNRGIYVMNSDGSNLKRILPLYVQNGYGYISGEQVGFLALNASWYPDGRHIIYEGFFVTRLWRARPEEYSGIGIALEGSLGFYKVNVDSAIAASTLPN